MRPRDWLLAASLCLNMFLAGSLVHGMLRDRHGPPPPPPPSTVVDEIVAILPAADGKIFRDAAAGHIKAMQQAHVVLSGIPKRIRAELLTPAVDVNALRRIFDEARGAHRTMDEGFEETLIDVVRRMSPEGRRKLAEWDPHGKD